MKYSANAPCPCHSHQKYKRCCQPYHKGSLPQTALQLMRSRYSAYALGLSTYIMDTTHPDNVDYTLDRAKWHKSIEDFSHTTQFLGLTIGEVIEGETLSYVTFEARFDQGSLREKSRFYRDGHKWLYESGKFTV